MRKVNEVLENNPSLRYGQAMYNTAFIELDTTLFKMSEIIGIDPYYNNSRCEMFVEYLIEKGALKNDS